MITEHDRNILARTIWGEARGEPYEGKVAVGRTVVNRFQSGRWYAGSTIAETAQKDWQYSCWNKNDPNRAKILAIDSDDPSLQEYLRAADDALQGLGPDWLHGATHYYATSIGEPNWAFGHTPAGRIGNHIFYCDID